MDNIDGIIKAALDITRPKPSEDLINRTAVLMSKRKDRDNRTVLNLIFIYNIAFIAAASASVCFIAPELGLYVYILCLCWLCTVLPVFIVAKDIFSKEVEL